MRDLPCKRLQVDEIWAYVGKKQAPYQAAKTIRARVGDQWTFVAMDARRSLFRAFALASATKPHAIAFMTDLSERLANRVQLSTDALEFICRRR